MNLDELALKYNTDKSSLLHNYTEKYELYFSPLRDKSIKILEIGIQNGYSLKTWKEYFQNAEIFGVDIVDCHGMDEDRIKTLKGSQTDLAFLQKINTDFGPFDIIIDDGSHYNTDMTVSFDILFPLLKNGGLYVVEDLHSTYWPQFSDGGRSFVRRLRKLTNSLNGRGKWGLADMRNESHDEVYKTRMFGNPNWWDQSVEYIHLYRSIVFIKKHISASTDIPIIHQKFQMRAKAWRLLERAWHKIIKRS